MHEEVKEKLYRKRKCKFTKKLRRRMTPEEKILWKVLRDRRCRGMKFRRQVNIGPYIVDFLCKQHRLIVEVDGGIHESQKEYDCDRDAYLRELNYRVLRIKNDEVHISLTEVLERTHNFICSH